MSDFNAQVIADLKAHGGKPGGYFEKAPVLLLYSIGAKSGEERRQPLMYLHRQADGPWYVFASHSGAPKNPAWFHNLVAHPDIDIEVGDGTTIYAEQARLFPQFAQYEVKTTRDVIPVLELMRR